MMWVLMSDIMWTSSVKPSMVVSQSISLHSDMSNIMVMSMMVLTMNYLMMMKAQSKSEEKYFLVVTAVGALVSFSFTLESPFLYLVFMEMTVIPLAYIIIISSKDKDKMESIKFMVMMNTAGSVPFMLYASISENFMMKELTYSNMCFEAGMLTFMWLFLIKTPIFLAHLWLTKAHVAASGNCSMILASIMIKMGTVGILKFYKNFEKEKSMMVMLSLALVGSIYLTAIMFRFFDSKTLIALSSVLHMSMLTPMMMMQKSSTILASMMMMTAHGIISYFLFYLITIKYEITENRTSLSMKSMEASDKTFNIIMAMFMLLNLGIPPMMNFLSECTFMHALGCLNSVWSQTIMGLILMMSVMFTMQMMTNSIFGSPKATGTKSEPASFITKSSFYLMWSIIIILAL